MTAVTDTSKPERVYAPFQFEARDEMPDDFRRMVLRLLRETNEIGSVKVCYDQMRDMTKNVALAPDPVSRVRIVEFFADEMRHQKIFDGVVRAMGVVPGEDFAIWKRRRRHWRGLHHGTASISGRGGRGRLPPVCGGSASLPPGAKTRWPATAGAHWVPAPPPG